MICVNGTWTDGAGRSVTTTPVQMVDVPRPDGRQYVLPRAWAEEAYREYAEQYGTQQSLERLEERGGFAVAEIISLLIDALARARAPVATQTAEAMPEGWRETAREVVEALSHTLAVIGACEKLTDHTHLMWKEARALLARPEVKAWAGR